MEEILWALICGAGEGRGEERRTGMVEYKQVKVQVQVKVAS